MGTTATPYQGNPFIAALSEPLEPEDVARNVQIDVPGHGQKGLHGVCHIQVVGGGT